MFLRYDERSDVWSLGCILLELATTGFLDVRKLVLFIVVFFPFCVTECIFI